MRPLHLAPLCLIKSMLFFGVCVIEYVCEFVSGVGYQREIMVFMASATGNC